MRQKKVRLAVISCTLENRGPCRLPSLGSAEILNADIFLMHFRQQGSPEVRSAAAAKLRGGRGSTASMAAAPSVSSLDGDYQYDMDTPAPRALLRPTDHDVSAERPTQPLGNYSWRCFYSLIVGRFATGISYFRRSSSQRGRLHGRPEEMW